MVGPNTSSIQSFQTRASEWIQKEERGLTLPPDADSQNLRVGADRIANLDFNND